MRTTTSLVAAAALLVSARTAHAAPPPRAPAARAKRQAPPPRPPPQQKNAVPPAASAPPPVATPVPAAALPQSSAQAPAVRPARAAAAPTDRRLLSNSSDVVLPERELHGHYFLAPLSLNLPFVTSHVSSSTAVLSTDFPDIPDGSGGTFDLRFFTLAQVFDVQIGLFDRLALRAFIQGAATAPDEADAALLVALDGGYSGGAGATVQALKSEFFALAGSLDWTHGQNITVTPGPYVADLVDKLIADAEDGTLDGFEPDPDLLFTELSSDELSFSAQAAASPHEFVGFFAEAGWDMEFDSDDRNDAFLRLGGGVSLNFESAGVPVGLLGYYVQRFAVDDENSTGLDQLFAGGLYYTGRRYLDLGLEVQRVRAEFDDVEQASLGVAARIRAYF